MFLYDPVWVQEALCEIGRYRARDKSIDPEIDDDGNVIVAAKVAIDGFNGPKSRNAMVNFKIGAGLNPRPRIGPKTIKALQEAVGRKMPKPVLPSLEWLEGTVPDGERVSCGNLYGALVDLDDGRTGVLLAVDHDARKFQLRIEGRDTWVDATPYDCLGPVVSVGWPVDVEFKGVCSAPWVTAADVEVSS